MTRQSQRIVVASPKSFFDMSGNLSVFAVFAIHEQNFYSSSAVSSQHKFMVKVCNAKREKLRLTLKDFPHTHFDERKNCCCSFISIIQIKFTPHYVSSRAVCRHHQLERETRDETFKGNTQNTKKNAATATHTSHLFAGNCLPTPPSLVEYKS